MKDLLSRLFTRPARGQVRPAAEAMAAEPPPPERPASPVGGFLDTVDQPMFVFDDRSRLAAVSPPLLHLLGLHEHEAVGRSVGDLFDGSPGWLEGASQATIHFENSSGVGYGAIVDILPVPTGSDQGDYHLAQLSGVGVDVTSDVSAIPINISPVRGHGPEEFATAVASLLKRRHGSLSVTAGRIEVIGLRDVKAALGPRWPTIAAKAQAVARSVVTRRLAAEDVFSEMPDDRFLICFASLDVNEAHVKAKLIAHEIHEKLLGVTDAPLVVETQVEPITLADEKAAERPSLVSDLLRMMDDARETRRRADAVRVADILRSASLRLQPVLGRSLAETGLMFAHLDAACDVELADLTADDGGKAAAELDALLLGLTARDVFATPDGHSQAVVVPVHYSSLHDRRFAADYLALCRSLAPSVRSRLLFEIHGLAPDVPDLRLQDLLSLLVPFSAHRMLRLSTLDHRFADLARFRVAMVTIEARHAAPASPRTGKKFPGLVSMARAGGSCVAQSRHCGCRVLVHDVPGKEDARWYVGHGADFVVLRASEPGRAAGPSVDLRAH